MYVVAVVMSEGKPATVLCIKLLAWFQNNISDIMFNRNKNKVYNIKKESMIIMI